MDWKEKMSHAMHSTRHLKLDIITTILPSFFLTFLLTTLWSHINLNFLIEYFLLVLPLILNLTIFSGNKQEFLFMIILTCLTFTIFTLNCKQESLRQTKRPQFKRVSFITNFRATTILLTGISILAVDFDIYPPYFRKTVSYGFSLMDLGVGLFVYTNGIVAPEIGSKKSIFKIVKSALPLFILGILRLISTRTVNYKVPHSEYGVHWNFFITLFVVKVMASLIMNCIGSKYVLVNAISLLFSHEILLQMGLAHYVMMETPRDNFFDANKEGLVSSLGYVGLYFLSVYVGKELHLKADRNLQEKWKLFKKLVVFAALLFFSTVYLEKSFGISRRLANTGYCIWTMFIGVFMTGLFCFGEIIQQYLFENKGYFKFTTVPIVLEAINYNGLVFFLTSNVLTGLINLTIDTKATDEITSLLIINIYMFICCYINVLLYNNVIRIRL